MGAWGHKAFENDEASDWVYDLESSEDGELVTAALAGSFEEYVESPEGDTARAAAEVVAAALGHGREDLPEEVTLWVSKYGSTVVHLKDTAVRTLQRVVGEESELRELWEEAEEVELFEEDVNDCIRRLQA